MSTDSFGANRPSPARMSVASASAAVALTVVLAISLGAVARIDVAGVARMGARPQPGAVVWLEAPSAAPSPPPGKVVLDQRNLTFLPHVLAVRVGTTVELPNNDRVFHNVFSFHDGGPFDLGLYPAGTVKRVRFDKPGLSRVFCNIHAGMAAYVMVVDSPYFAVSDERGNFSIPSVPPATYAYHAWHPGGRTIDGSAVIEAGVRLEIQWP